MKNNTFHPVKYQYILKTGNESIGQLKGIDSFLGEGTRNFLTNIKFKRFKSFADIGCGHGQVSFWVANNLVDGSVVGFDQSDKQIEVCLKKSSGTYKNIQFTLSCAKNLQSDDSSFDCCYTRFTLMHIDKPKDALQEMIRVTKPNGFIALEEGNILDRSLHPYFEPYEICKMLLYNLLHKTGKSPNIYREIKPFLDSLDNVKCIYKKTYHKTTTNSSEIKESISVLLYGLVDSATDAFIAADLIDMKAILNILSKLKNYIPPQNARLSYGTIYQLAYQKIN